MQVDMAWTKLDLAADEGRLSELARDLADPRVWQDHAKAAELGRAQADLERRLAPWLMLREGVAEAMDLAALNDSSMAAELTAQLQSLVAEYDKMEFALKLSGRYDRANAVISIHAGTGGTDAQDWAEMLMRMYLRYAELTGYASEVLEFSKGEEAGVKSVTLEVRGAYAYGKLKGEHGVHRLVRQSPFNADHLRQTSFALVEVLPLVEGPAEIEVDPKDLKIDVYRSSGPGGQSVNTTDSAVRITHSPTGIVVAIQSERSQLQNKEKAMAILKSRLIALMAEQHQADLDKLKGPSQQAAWGSQIRSYVLHPYNLVKDHRTGYETAKTDSVLNGEIEPLLEAYLQSQIAIDRPEA